MFMSTLQQHQPLQQTTSSHSSHRQEVDDLARSNQVLSDTISRVEERNRVMQSKLDAAKSTQRALKHAVAMQCKFC